MTEDKPVNVPDKVYFRESIDGEKIGPLSLVEVKSWYEKGTTLPYNEFSVDGRQWRAMVNRNYNSPDFPFCSFDDESIGMRSIDVPKEDSDFVYNRDKMLWMRETSESSSFLPLFFCPQAFHQCAIRSADIAVRSKGRIDRETTGRLAVVDSIRQVYDNVFENDVTPDVPENKSLDALPWPAIDPILYFLRNDHVYTDLNNLSQVSTPFRKIVKEFVSKEGNRPAIKRVGFLNKEEGLMVKIALFAANVPFHNLIDLDWCRVERDLPNQELILRVTLQGLDDNIIQQVIDLLSTRIDRVWIMGVELSEHLPFIDLLLQHSIIDSCILEVDIDDTTAPLIVAIYSRVTKLCNTFLTTHSQVSNPSLFITQLDHLVCPLIALNSVYLPFFGLSHSFWSSFLNEKLSSGEVEYVLVSTVRKQEKHTNAPFPLPAHPSSIWWKDAAR